MATITYCDRCHKKQDVKTRGEWTSLSITYGNFKIPGWGDYFADIKLCPNCGKMILTKLAASLKRKKG